MKPRTTRRVDALVVQAALIVVAALTAACVAPIDAPSPSAALSPSAATPPAAASGSPDGPSGPSPAASLDLAGLDDATATAVQIRTSYGLPSDLEHIRKVVLDPTATTEFGTPMLQAEISEIFARSERADAIIPDIQTYTANNRPVFGGLWIDQPAGGVVTVSFTDDLARHRAALAAILGPRGVVAVVQARYAESVMLALQDRIAADNAWFKTIPAGLQGVSYDVMRNVVSIDLSTANPDITALVLARFGVPEDALEVRSDGTGVALEPWGTIHLRIVDVPANVRSELILNYHSDRPGAGCGMGDVGIGFGQGTRVDLPCQGGHWTIEALRSIDDIVARGEVDLEPGGTATVTLRPIAP
jgi:hypothetical protein